MTQLLSFEQFIINERANADNMRNAWLNPPDDPKSKQQNDVVYYAGLELAIEMEHNKITGAYTYSDKKQHVNWLDYFDDNSHDVLEDLATGDSRYGDDSHRKYTNPKKLDSVEVMFPNQYGEELTVYYTEPDEDGEYEIDASCLDKNGVDFGQYLNDDAVDLIYSLVDKKVK